MAARMSLSRSRLIRARAVKALTVAPKKTATLAAARMPIGVQLLTSPFDVTLAIVPNSTPLGKLWIPPVDVAEQLPQRHGAVALLDRRKAFLALGTYPRRENLGYGAPVFREHQLTLDI